MKLLRISVIALVLSVGAQFAKAQVRVGIGVNIGAPVRYVESPYYEDYDRVVYERPVVVRRYYARPAYYGGPAYYGRPAYFGPRYYNRPVYRQEVYREHFNRGRGHGYGRGHGRW
jgi:hypothetical protein